MKQHSPHIMDIEMPGKSQLREFENGVRLSLENDRVCMTAWERGHLARTNKQTFESGTSMKTQTHHFHSLPKI